MVKFEGSVKNRKVKDDESNSQEDYGEEPEYEIMDEIEETEAIHDHEEEEEPESIELEVEKPNRRIDGGGHGGIEGERTTGTGGERTTGTGGKRTTRTGGERTTGTGG